MAGAAAWRRAREDFETELRQALSALKRGDITERQYDRIERRLLHAMRLAEARATYEQSRSRQGGLKRYR